MPLGEPKCGVCGSDLMAGMFHTCKPSWNEENTRIRAELERWKSACGEYYQAKKKLADELKEANLQISELKKHWATRAAFEVLVKKVDETSRLNGEYRAALQRIHKLMTDTVSAGEGVCNRVYEIAKGALTEKPKNDIPEVMMTFEELEEKRKSEKWKDESHECWVDGGICPVDGSCTCWCHKVKV